MKEYMQDTTLDMIVVIVFLALAVFNFYLEDMLGFHGNIILAFVVLKFSMINSQVKLDNSKTRLELMRMVYTMEAKRINDGTKES